VTQEPERSSPHLEQLATDPSIGFMLIVMQSAGVDVGVYNALRWLEFSCIAFRISIYLFHMFSIPMPYSNLGPETTCPECFLGFTQSLQ
jgi:hypothetical protein